MSYGHTNILVDRGELGAFDARAGVAWGVAEKVLDFGCN